MEVGLLILNSNCSVVMPWSYVLYTSCVMVSRASGDHFSCVSGLATTAFQSAMLSALVPVLEGVGRIVVLHDFCCYCGPLPKPKRSSPLPLRGIIAGTDK